MASAEEYALILDELDSEAQATHELDPEFFYKIVNRACTRLPLLNKLGRAARLEGFTKSGAWIDAVLALIELELPAWKICRLLYEDSQWTCSISRYPNLAFFGDVAEGAHESLPLAMVRAFLDAVFRPLACRSRRGMSQRPGRFGGLCCGATISSNGREPTYLFSLYESAIPAISNLYAPVRTSSQRQETSA